MGVSATADAAAARAAFLACAAATAGRTGFAGVVDFAGLVVVDDRDVVDGELDAFFDVEFVDFEVDFDGAVNGLLETAFCVAELDVFDELDTDGPAELALELELASEAVALGESAHATPQPAKTAAPIPSATAKPPTLPTYSPAPMISAPLDAFTRLEISHA